METVAKLEALRAHVDYIFFLTYRHFIDSTTTTVYILCFLLAPV